MRYEDVNVAIWIGRAESDEALDNYLRIAYTEDGDAMPSEFGMDFKIERYDEDALEAGLKRTTTDDVRELFRGHSSATRISAAVRTMHTKLPEAVNTVVMLFDFEYNGIVTRGGQGQVGLLFLGNFQLSDEK